MRILYVITGLGLGGAEKVVCDLADQLSNLGHNVVIAYLTGEILVRPKNLNINIVFLGLNSFSQLYSSSKKYKELIQNFQPDVVHAHMVHANIFTRLCRLFIRIPRLICSAHSKNEGGKLRMLAYRITHNLSDITSNVSQEACNNFIMNKAVPESDILKIYNGINLKNFLLKDSELISLKKQLNIALKSKVFIAIGRFHEAKDYPNLINAFHFFLKNIEQKSLYHLLIVGDGDLTLIKEIKNLIQIYNLDNNIHLLGRRDDIVDLLSGADLFVLSSKYEGLPTVIIEAMACEKFVVATDCGGSAEILGETGILVPIENSEALAKGLEIAMNLTENQIRENGKLARKRVEALFSLEASVSKWLALYEAK